MNLEMELNKDSAIDFTEGISNLITGIKKDYSKWTDWSEGIERFNNGIDIKTGRKYTKVICGNCVWGFIANSDGILKGIPYFKGDVYMAAGWADPAKLVRGFIFDTNQNWFRWTGPNYRV